MPVDAWVSLTGGLKRPCTEFGAPSTASQRSRSIFFPDSCAVGLDTSSAWFLRAYRHDLQLVPEHRSPTTEGHRVFYELQDFPDEVPWTVCCLILQTYRNTGAYFTNFLETCFVHFNYDNKFGIATCIGLNLKVRPQLLISFNMKMVSRVAQSV